MAQSMFLRLKAKKEAILTPERQFLMQTTRKLSLDDICSKKNGNWSPQKEMKHCKIQIWSR